MPIPPAVRAGFGSAEVRCPAGRSRRAGCRLGAAIGRSGAATEAGGRRSRRSGPRAAPGATDPRRGVVRTGRGWWADPSRLWVWGSSIDGAPGRCCASIRGRDHDDQRTSQGPRFGQRAPFEHGNVHMRPTKDLVDRMCAGQGPATGAPPGTRTPNSRIKSPNPAMPARSSACRLMSFPHARGGSHGGGVSAGLGYLRGHTEHRWSTATDSRCSIGVRGGGAVQRSKQRTSIRWPWTMRRLEAGSAASEQAQRRTSPSRGTSEQVDTVRSSTWTLRTQAEIRPTSDSDASRSMVANLFVIIFHGTFDVAVLPNT